MRIFLISASIAVLCSGIFSSCAGNPTTGNSEFETGDSILVVEDTVVSQEPLSNWIYNETLDEMTDDTSYLAYTISENVANFDFPYNGGSNLVLYLRNDPQYGKHVFIKITQGQFNTSIIDGQTIKVRFDSDKAFNVHCDGASDHSMDVLFLNGYKKLVDRMKTAKTMKVSVEFYNQGTHTFTFNVENLKWEH
jgi:hypothetical protein